MFGEHKPVTVHLRRDELADVQRLAAEAGLTVPELAKQVLIEHCETQQTTLRETKQTQ